MNIEEYYKNKKPLKYYEDKNIFTPEQLKLIRIGLNVELIDVDIYAKPEYDYNLMNKIMWLLRHKNGANELEKSKYDEKINLLIIENT